MARLEQTFRTVRRAGRAALVPFVMGGDPDVATTGHVIEALADNGADLIEVGIPFSDPLADGPTIQAASARALNAGTTPSVVLEMIRCVSARVPVPIVVLSYWNPMVHYGGSRRHQADAAAFVQAAKAAGVSGIITPDLPPEEAQAYREVAHRAGVATIFLAAPTSPSDRLRRIARASSGFLYYVSVTGTTGVRRRLASEWVQKVRQLKLITTKPICVGFGISTPAQAAMIGRVADGVIIGSALIRALAPYARQRRRLVRRAAAFLRPFREVV